MKGSSKFEVRPLSSKALRRSRSSKQIRRAKVPLTPTRSVDVASFVNVGLANDSFPLTPALSLGEREKIWRAPSWRKLGMNFGAGVRPLTSAATRSIETLIFGFRVSGFEFRTLTSCK
jgi:hypothetical protein